MPDPDVPHPDPIHGPEAQRVTVISVCYNSEAVLPAMLNSLPRETPVVLVDNASEDAAALENLAAPENVTLIRNGRNIGFGAACNTGAAAATTPYLFFLNPDAECLPGAIESLVQAAEAHPEGAGFNPRIRNPDGSEYFKRGSVLLPKDRWLPRGWPTGTAEVPILTGAALFVSKADFDAVGGFDPAIFLYHEDDDLSLRLATPPRKLYSVAGAEVRHIGGASSVRSPEGARWKARHMGRSRVYAARKHAVAGEPARAVRQALFGVLSPLGLFSKRKRWKALGFLDGVWSELRTPGAPAS